MLRIDEINRRWEEAAASADTRAKKDSRKAAAKPSAQGYSPGKDLLSLLLKVGSIIAVFTLLFSFLFGLLRCRETSMAPAIKDGDLVLFYRYSGAGYLPQDVIVLKYRGQKQARRVIATAGDTVDITEDGLVINGALQQEPEIFQITRRYLDGENFPQTVPEGQVFVLGDYRPGAADSRVYGCVRLEETLGKVMAVIRRRGI